MLKKLKIGVHLLGDDYTNPPPVHELSKRGVVDNVVGFSTFYSAENPPSAIIDAVASGKIDLAIVWGPIAGYFAARQRVPLELVPDSVRKGRPAVRVRHRDGRQERRRGAEGACGARCVGERSAEIAQILKEYGVPLVDDGRNHTK